MHTIYDNLDALRTILKELTFSLNAKQIGGDSLFGITHSVRLALPRKTANPDTSHVKRNTPEVQKYKL